MMAKLHSVKAPRINHVQTSTAPLLAAMILGVGLPNPNVTTLLVALAFVGVVVMMLRLRRRARADQTARLEAERQAALADNIQQLVAAVWRARTPAAVIETCLPEFLHVLTAAAGAVVVIDEGVRSGEIVRAAGCDSPLPRAPFPLSAYPALENVTSRQAIAAFDASGPSGSADRVAILDFLASHPVAVALPLMTAGRTIAVLIAGFHEPRNLTLDERDALLNAGRRTAQASVRAQGRRRD